MSDTQRIWIRERATKGGKTAYDLRYIDSATHKWRSKSVGSDRKRADREASLLEASLNAGTHLDIHKTPWSTFQREHVASIPGRHNRVEAERILSAFSEHTGDIPPRRVTFAMVEGFVATCRAKGNRPSTINHNLKYLRAAFNAGIRRGHLARNPLAGWKFEKVDEQAIRVLTDEEEVTLLGKATELYGQRFEAFIQVSVATGGRRSEVLGLTWANIDTDGLSVTYVLTKGKRDRFVPFNDDLVPVFQRLRVQTQRSPGPFTDWNGDDVSRMFNRTAKLAGVADVSLHDLRRTFITRLIKANTALPTVQKLAGHANITTTCTFYNRVSVDDLRAAVAKLAKPAVSAG